MKHDDDREVVVSHQSDLLTQDLILSGIHEHCDFRKHGMNFNFPFIKYEHSSGDISYPKLQIEILKSTVLDKNQYYKLIGFLENELSIYRRFLNKFEKEIKTDKDKILKIKRYFEASKRAASIIPYFAFERGLQKILQEKGISLQNISSTHTDTAKASAEIERIAQKYSKILKQGIVSKKLHDDLRKYCDRYGYLGMIYFRGEPWTVSDAYSMLFAPKSTHKFKQKVSRDWASDVASKLLSFRTENWEAMCYGTYLFRKYFIKCFGNEMPYSNILSMRINEVLNIIHGKYYQNDISKGRNYFILEIRKNGVFFEVTEKKEETVEHLVQEIRGVAACPGVVSGFARIVISHTQTYKVQEGDILVTKMSTPDFLPAMKKSAAIVTDIGGITSHAAIVSRELKKPCIIGTKIATKVLKDGDYVEVDAGKGVVKVIRTGK